MSIENDLEQRFKELLTEGQRLIETAPHDEKGNPDYWIPARKISEYQRWIGSTMNLIKLIDQSSGTFSSECDHLQENNENKIGVAYRMMQKLFGLLSATYDEWQRGLLRKMEYIVVAEAFDDFLDHAELYHKSNKKIESSILASVVLEDSVKRIAKKNGLNTKGISLEPLIDDLVKKNIFTPVKAKRIKGFSGVRNRALHAEWEEIDIMDVGDLIAGTRELIDVFL
jgi:hypothetical protein